MCPDLRENNASISQICNLQVRIKRAVSPDSDFTLVAQYSSSDITLFDGVTQRVKADLSPTAPRHFQYALLNLNTLTVFLKSSTPANYRVLARIEEAADFVQRRADYAGSQDAKLPGVFAGETARTGITSLVVPGSKLSKLKCKRCLMLISVFGKAELPQADFRVEVAQSLATVGYGDSRHGYVESGLAMEYELNARLGEEAVVSVSGMHDECVTLEAFERAPTSGDYANLTQHNGHNPIVFEKAEKPKVYMIRVVGVAACSYHISFVSTNKRVLEILDGVPIELALK